MNTNTIMANAKGTLNQANISGFIKIIREKLTTSKFNIPAFFGAIMQTILLFLFDDNLVKHRSYHHSYKYGFEYLISCEFNRDTWAIVSTLYVIFAVAMIMLWLLRAFLNRAPGSLVLPVIFSSAQAFGTLFLYNYIQSWSYSDKVHMLESGSLTVFISFLLFVTAVVSCTIVIKRMIANRNARKQFNNYPAMMMM